MTRNESYDYIKSNKLESEIKEKFKKPYSSVSTDELNKFISKYQKESKKNKCSESSTEKDTNKITTIEDTLKVASQILNDIGNAENRIKRLTKALEYINNLNPDHFHYLSNGGDNTYYSKVSISKRDWQLSTEEIQRLFPKYYLSEIDIENEKIQQLKNEFARL